MDIPRWRWIDSKGQRGVIEWGEIAKFTEHKRQQGEPLLSLAGTNILYHDSELAVMDRFGMQRPGPELIANEYQRRQQHSVNLLSPSSSFK